MTQVAYFDGRGTDIKGVYNKPFDTIYINSYLDDIEKKKVTYHELGHKGHTSADYKYNRERCELQADRNMIHHLLKEELAEMDDKNDFNYVRFMEKYNLKTTVNETMVIEEFNGLVG